MKKCGVFIFVFIFIGILCYNVSAASNIPETNLDGTYVSESWPTVVTYSDGSTETFTDINSFITLYINGSIIKNANIIIENNRTLVPLRLISESLGAKVDWDGSTRKVTITDGNNKIELVIGDDKPTLNGSPIPIDVAPRIIHDYTFVPLRFIAESLGCMVDWFDGSGIKDNTSDLLLKPHYPIGTRQVMISRYPADAKMLSQTDAIGILKTQLIMAYEKQYDVKFSPLDVQPATWVGQDNVRYLVSHLSVKYENDRFFVIPMEVDFMVDKFTGTVFTDFHGIYWFNPNSTGALAFAG